MRPRVRLPQVHFISVTSYPEVDIRDALEVFTQLADHNLSLHENAGQKSTQNLDTVLFLTVFGCFRPSFRLQYIELVVSLVPRLRQWRKEGKQVTANFITIGGWLFFLFIPLFDTIHVLHTQAGLPGFN